MVTNGHEDYAAMTKNDRGEFLRGASISRLRKAKQDMVDMNEYQAAAEICDELDRRKAARNPTTTATDAKQVGGTHYKDMALQPWAVMQALLTPEEWRGYLKGNIIKYGMRQGRKDGASDDAEKAKHYMEKLAEANQQKEGGA